MSLLAGLEGFGVEVLMNGVDLIVIFLYFELLIREGVDASADDAHLVLIEAQVLDAVGVLHDLLHADGQVLKG
jgi:hypothetical protein